MTSPSSVAPFLHRRIVFHPPFRTATASPASFSSPPLHPINSLPVEPPSSRNGEEAVPMLRCQLPLNPHKPLDHHSEMLEFISIRKIGAGLENLGNTCFLNSVLQCLTYTPPLAAYLQSGRHKSTCRVSGFCATCALEAHVKQALAVPGRVISPTNLVKNLRCISRSFHVGRQEDAHEYMRYLIEALQKSCLPVLTPSDPFQKMQNLIHKIFGGRLRSQVKCMHCSFCSNTYDPFLDLSLEIVRAESLQKALARFTAVEELDGDNKYRCSKCKMKVRALKQFTVDKAPQILTIQFKRFSSSGGLGGKIDKKIQFDRTLNMKPFVSNGEDDEPLQYTLYAVLVHSGGSTRSGHYYCFVRTATDMWHVLDDRRVSQVSEKTVLDQKAYILFYMREPLPNPLFKIQNNPCGKSSKQILHGNATAADRDVTRTSQEKKLGVGQILPIEARGQVAVNDVKENVSLGCVNDSRASSEGKDKMSPVSNGQIAPLLKGNSSFVTGNGHIHDKQVNQQIFMDHGGSSCEKNKTCAISRSGPVKFSNFPKSEMSGKVKLPDATISEYDRSSKTRPFRYMHLLFPRARCYFLMRAIAILRRRKLVRKGIRRSHRIQLQCIHQTLSIADKKITCRVKGKKRALISEGSTTIKKQKPLCGIQPCSNSESSANERGLEKYHSGEDKSIDNLDAMERSLIGSVDQPGICISSAKESYSGDFQKIVQKMVANSLADDDSAQERSDALLEPVSELKLQLQDVSIYEPHSNGVKECKEINSNEVAQLQAGQTRTKHVVTSTLAGSKSIRKTRIENGNTLFPADDTNCKLYGTAVPPWSDLEAGNREIVALLHDEGGHCGHVLDDWDEEYDRGKRKKVRNHPVKFQNGNLEVPNGRNPFQVLVSRGLHGVDGEKQQLRRKHVN